MSEGEHRELDRLKAELAAREANIRRLQASIASKEATTAAAFPYSRAISELQIVRGLADPVELTPLSLPHLAS